MFDMNDISKTQRAWRAVRRGHPSQALEFTQNAPVRTDLKDGEVLVKVGAAALNPVGYHPLHLLPNFVAGRPYDAAEYDLAGTVVLSKSPHHSPGDKVYGWIEPAVQQRTKQGALTEYTVLSGEVLVARPQGLSAQDAAGISLTANTAYMGLFDVAGLEPGQTVFINGGSSSVGAYAIQIAKAKGLKVWTSTSGKNEEFVRSLGVDEFLDYTKEPLEKALARNPPSPKFHAILDAVGLLSPSLYTHSAAYLAPGGLYLSVGSTPEISLRGLSQVGQLVWAAFLHPTFLGGTPRGYKFFSLKFTRPRLEAVADLIAEGKVRPVVDSVHGFENVLDAYSKIMSGRAKGKVIVSIDPNC